MKKFMRNKIAIVYVIFFSVLSSKASFADKTQKNSIVANLNVLQKNVGEDQKKLKILNYCYLAIPVVGCLLLDHYCI